MEQKQCWVKCSTLSLAEWMSTLEFHYKITRTLGKKHNQRTFYYNIKKETEIMSILELLDIIGR